MFEKKKVALSGQRISLETQAAFSPPLSATEPLKHQGSSLRDGSTDASFRSHVAARPLARVSECVQVSEAYSFSVPRPVVLGQTVYLLTAKGTLSAWTLLPQGRRASSDLKSFAVRNHRDAHKPSFLTGRSPSTQTNIATSSAFAKAQDPAFANPEWTLSWDVPLHTDAAPSMVSVLQGGQAHLWSDGRRLFVSASTGHVWAFDRNGHQIWHRYAASWGGLAAPGCAAVSSGGRSVLAVVTPDGVQSRWDPLSGKSIWDNRGYSQNAGVIETVAPVLDGGRMIVVHPAGDVVCWRVSDGTPIWSSHMDPSARSDAPAPHVKSQPVIQDGHLYAVGHYGPLSCVSVTTGKVLWVTPMASHFPPLIAHGLCWIVTKEGQLAAVQIATGTVRHQVDLGPQTQACASPILVGGRVCVLTNQGRILSWDPARMDRLPSSISLHPWKASSSSAGALVPLSSDAAVVLTESGHLMAVTP